MAGMQGPPAGGAPPPPHGAYSGGPPQQGHGAPQGKAPQRSYGGGPATLGKRALISLVTALGTGVFVLFAWFILGFVIFGMAWDVKHKDSNMGFSVFLVAPLGAVVASVTAFLIGLLPYGNWSWLRWLTLPLVFIALGVALFGALAFAG